MEEKEKKDLKRSDNKKNENVEKKTNTTKSTKNKATTKQAKSSTVKEAKKSTKKSTKPKQIKKEQEVQNKPKQIKEVKKPTSKVKEEVPEIKKEVPEIKKETPEIKKEATKVKQIKVEAKPVNNGYTRVKTVKQTKKGKSGIVLLIVLLIILAIFLINVYRKYSILTNLDNKFNQYVGRDNYHKTAVYDGYENNVQKVEAYKKGNTVKNIIYAKNAKLTQITSTTGGTKTFFDTPNGKVMRFENDNKSFILALNDINYAGEQKLLNSIITPIYSEKVDNIDCYVLSAKKLHKVEGTKSFKVYIEKETGLVKQIIEERIINGEEKTLTIKYTNEYNSVTDNDLSAPSDIGEYIIKND